MNSLTLTAQVIVGGAGIASWVIWLIIVAAIIGIGLVILKQMNIVVPDFVVKIGWIIVLAVVGVLAIRFLAQMVGVV